MMPAAALSADQLVAALDIARALALAGNPVFVASADTGSAAGFRLPIRWQDTRPDPAVVDLWRPGMALAMVTGHRLAVIDVDPRNGGDLAALDGSIPVSYGAVTTPSGGVHSFIRSPGVRKKTGLLPGVDLQAGAPDGSGRGFVFLPPTVRLSKTTGAPVAYRWATHFDFARFQVCEQTDVSGQALAELVLSSTTAASTAAAGGAPAPSAEDFMQSGPWANVEATLAEGRNNGVAKLAAALRGRGGWRVEDAERFMYAEVWPLIDQAQGGHPFPAEEFEAAIRAQFKQYPDGAEQRAALAAIPPTPVEPPSPLRYFSEKGVFLAATLAADVTALGPLAAGIDDIMWAYQGGVWRPAKHAVRDRVVFLLGERYRPGHARNVEDIVRGQVPTITCEPIPELINMRNGLLNWRTGQLQPHSPDVLSTVQLNVEYDPSARCPAFERFIEQVVAPDVVETIFELIGYMAYSGNPLHKAIQLFGPGGSGKTTFLNVLVALLGRANVTTISLHDLVNTRFTTASLFGKLANIAGDIDGGYLENTAVLKAITGGDMISAEHKGRDRFDFTPWAVPVFSANKIPASADTTSGYLRRWFVVNFPNSFIGRENRHLSDLLSTPGELAGIAARGLAALPRLLDRGDFPVTESALAARDEFARRVDQVRTWLFDCAALDQDAPWTPRTELYQTYQRWATRDGHRPVKASEFYDRLDAAGAVPAKVRGVRGYNGVRVIDAGYVYPMGAAGAAFTHSISPTPTAAPSGTTQHDAASLNGSAAAPTGTAAPTDSPVKTGGGATQGAAGAANALPHAYAYVRTHEGVGESLPPLPPTSADVPSRPAATGR